MTVKPWELTRTPASLYTQLKVEGGNGTITTINGSVAYVVPPDNDTGGIGSVDFVRSGIEVSVIGQTGSFTQADLQNVASSVS